jgi:two-component system phosphate regulon sensor histidine kinase PhoR
MLAAAALGYLAMQVVLALLLALAAFLGWHSWQLVRLVTAFAHKTAEPDATGKGIWSYLHTTLAEVQAADRKRKRRAARLESRFHEAANTLPDAAVVLGRGWKVIWANPAALRLLGIHYPQCMGDRLWDLVRHPVLDEFIHNGDLNHSLELQSPADAGIVVSIVLKPFGKKKRQKLLLARDVTRTYHLDQARRDFVANVSHELRTPLTVITGFLELLADQGPTSEELAHSLRQMQHQASRMDGLISDLLALSKLEMEREAPKTQTVAVADLLQSIIMEAKTLSDASAHQVDLRADCQLNLRGVGGELRSAFSNLILNAVKHTPRGALVHVTWQRTNSGAEMSVSDTGEGIAARHIPRLTERFYRVDAGRSRDAGGTGLGLAIVKHALSRHGAELKVQSKVGHGCTFTCRFPRERLLLEEETTETADACKPTTAINPTGQLTAVSPSPQ